MVSCKIKKSSNILSAEKKIKLGALAILPLFIFFLGLQSFSNCQVCLKNSFFTKCTISLSIKQKSNTFEELYLFWDVVHTAIKVGGNDKTSSEVLYLSQSKTNDVEKELTDNVENQLNEIDFSQLDSIVNSLSDNQKQIFGGSKFLDVVKNLLYGTGADKNTNFISYIFNIIIDDLINLLPCFMLIIAIAIVYSLIGQFSLDKGKSVASIVHIACFCVISLIVLNTVISIMREASGVILTISNQMEVVFPVLLTLISAIGGTATATTFQPALATLTTLITKIFTGILIPIFIFCVVFNIVGNISNNIKLEKFSKFCSSFFNWTIGIVFTIFIAFLSINGLTVSSIDGISIKTAKYAIKSHIPILGSYLSDGISLIITSSNLIKNAVGVTGLVLLISTILSPIFKLIILMLLFKLVSAIIEPFCDQKISNFLFSMSKTLNMLNTCLIAIGFMYLISVYILMSCSNIF